VTEEAETSANFTYHNNFPAYPEELPSYTPLFLNLDLSTPREDFNLHDLLNQPMTYPALQNYLDNVTIVLTN
jgi:hypothetical protein